jgi:hypothetical protein
MIYAMLYSQHKEAENMKRAVLPLIVICGVLLIASSSYAQDAAQRELDSLMNQWVNSLKTENIDSFADCYWQDAQSVRFDPAGGSRLLEGASAIRGAQAEWFARVDYPSLGLDYPEPARFLPGAGDMPVYVFNVTKFKFIDIFYFQKRSGRYRILKHVLLLNPQGQ